MKPNPFNSDQLIAFALAHHHAGRLAEAEGIYRQILSKEPRNARVLDMLGVLNMQSGRLDVSEAFLRRAVAAEPSHANYRCNLGAVFRRLGKGDEAIAEFRQAVQLSPALAVAYNNLGIALAEKLEFEPAFDAYHKAIELDPGYAEAHSNLANVLSDAGQIDQALTFARRSIEIRSDDAASHNTLGVILVAAGRYADAVEAYRHAIALQPRYGDAHSNLGNALASMGLHAEALSASRRAVDLEPANLQSHWNYAVILLRSGDLTAGWREYEWRWKQQTHFPRPSPRYYPPRFPTPHWTGENIAGLTILIHAEQGFGDTLHFCRYAPLVAARGARVIIEAHPELCRLLKSLAGVQQVIPRGEALPAFDVHCPVMSLPLAFNTTLETVPGNVPYLRPDEADVARWKAIVNYQDHAAGVATQSPKSVIPRHHEESGRCDHSGRSFGAAQNDVETVKDILNVGLCWAGSPNHADDQQRSLSLLQLAPLASAGVRFHSLQNEGPAAVQASDPPSGMKLVDHSSRLGDFAETAALIANLDLVITADTAVAHLAGAMGKPVWVFLRYLSDWRWLIGRGDTPWYPTMKLFRQEKRGEWEPVVWHVAKELVLLSDLALPRIRGSRS